MDEKKNVDGGDTICGSVDTPVVAVEASSAEVGVTAPESTPNVRLVPIDDALKGVSQYAQRDRDATANFLRAHCINGVVPGDSDSCICYSEEDDAKLVRLLSYYRIFYNKTYRKRGDVIYRNINLPLLVCASMFLRMCIKPDKIVFDIDSVDHDAVYKQWSDTWNLFTSKYPNDVYKQYCYFALSALTAYEAN